jgi:hypothetical protein
MRTDDAARPTRAAWSASLCQMTLTRRTRPARAQSGKGLPHYGATTASTDTIAERPKGRRHTFANPAEELRTLRKLSNPNREPVRQRQPIGPITGDQTNQKPRAENQCEQHHLMSREGSDSDENPEPGEDDRLRNQQGPIE